MKQNPFKRLISLLVVFAMLCTMVPTAFAVTPSQFEDFPQGWSKEAMTFAVNNGIINGKSETAIEPESNLTRAEMAAIINRAFGAEVADDISEYTDVSKDAWYYNDIGVAVHMETFHGDGDGKMRPDDFITREEVMAVLARALVLEYEDFSPINKFGDYSSVSEWARPTLAALIGEGYVDGYEDKTLRPLNNITREEFVQLMYNIFKTYLSTEGESYKKVDPSDCVMINRPGITLSDVTIEGDLVIGDGVGSGKVYLNNVTIKGRLLARGGFITLKKVTTGKGVVVKNVNGRTHFYNYKKESVFDGVRELTYTTYLTTSGGGGSSGGGGGGGGGGSSTKYEYTINYYFQSAANPAEYVLDESRTVKDKATSGTSVKAETPEIANYVYNKDKSTDQIIITSGTNELKVYYDLVKYSVSYTNPDGTKGTADVAHGQELGDVVDMPGTYTDPDDNTFDVDWIYTDKDGNEIPVTPDTPITGEGTLTPVLYAKIVFDYNYPEADSVEVKAEKGKKIADLLPQNPERDGYTFEGWNTKPDGSGEPFDANTVVLSPATIYAIWKPVSVAPKYYTVTFVYNYENAPAEYFEKYENVLEGSKILKPATNPVRAGYNFEGWYKNAEGTVEFVFENENITSDTVIYAKWKEKTIVPTVHTVTFNLNGGSGNILPASVADGNKVSRPTQEPVLIGYTFAGWYTEPECINEYNFNTPVTSSFTLYAKWVEVKPDTYTVSFDTFGGSDIKPVTVTAGSTLLKPSTPTKTGYAFGGWYTDMNCTVAYDFSKPVNSSFTLYAKWIEVVVNKYTVEFITDSSDVIPPQIVQEGKKAVRPADPTKTGYTFGGWYTSTAYEIEYNFNTPITEDIAIYAKWIPEVYNVVFETNGGSSVESQEVEYGEKAVKPEDPSKDGYNFMGWYTDATFKNYYDFNTPVTSNLTLYAKWEEIILQSYVVTFETYGGTTLLGTPIKPQEVKAGDLMDRPADPVKPGHDFVGWYTDETFTTKFDFKAPVNSNLTVYAKYDIHTFEIRFESNGGPIISSQIIEYDKTVTEPEAPEKEGYTFIGWYSDYSLSVPYDFTTPVKEEFVLYAKWEIIVPNEYTVAFVNEGSTTIPAQKIKEGNKVTKPSTPRRTGYTFGGWYTDEQYQNVYDFNTPVYTSFTLYAKWNINIYDVVFESTGGTPVDTQYIPYNTTATEPEAPHKDGYVFSGWYTNKACTLLYDFSTPVIKDITLYAKWTARVPNQYYVTFRSNGGTSVGSQRVKEGNKAIEPTAPTRTGYTFDGWYSDSALTVRYDFDTAVNADITLYAKWNINKYVVSFVTNCNDTVDSQTVDYMSTVTEPAVPQNYGYTFKGWYTESGFVTKYNFATPVKGDMTLYAKWELNKYEIEFNTDGGTAIDKQTIDHGSKLSKPADPEKTGYTFGGWYSDSAYNNAYDFESEVVSELVLYAKWIINKYTVEFDSVYGSIVPEQIVEYGSKATEPQTPVREGYDFKGWYTNSSYTNLYDFDKAVESDLKLYAKWTIKEFTITFDMQDGNTTSQKVDYGTVITKPQTPEKEGYTFAGWYTDSGCTEEYDFGTAVTSEFTLYAKWNVNEYTVAFDSKGGSTISAQKVNHGNVITEPEAPEKSGFIFGGWYTDSECTEKYDFATPVKTSFTLYAKWTIKEFTITFDMQDGNTASQTVDYGTVITKPETPEKEGYTFAGWYTDSGCTEEYDFGTAVTSEFTLYAKWNVNEYTVAFDSKGGSTISAQKVNHGNVITEPEAPEKSGFIFGGWYTDSECTEKYDFATPVKTSFTLYAKWISVTEKFKVDFYYGVNESVAHIGTVNDVASGSTIAEDIYVKVFEDEGIFFEDEGMAGYKDGSYTHMIYPELRYLDENGKWQIFDETVKVVSNMKVYYTFKYIQLMLDGSFLGINLNNVSLNTHYASDTRFMDSLKDAMYLSRNPINNGLKGKDAEIIKKLSENTGFIDLDGYVEIKPFGLHISELIDNEDIHKEVVSYIEECLHGSEDVVRYIVGMTESQDIIECIGAENLSDTSVDGIVEYLLDHRYDNSESYAKLVAKIADIIETYGYFGEFMSSFYDKKADYEVNKNTVKLAKAVAEAVYEFSDTEVIRLLRNKGFGVVVDLYGEEEFKNMFAQSQKEYYNEVFAVADSVMNGETVSARYSTSLTVRVNIAELLGSVSEKINRKLVGRLSGDGTNDYYTKNPYLKEFVEQDIMDVLFTFNASAVSTTNSGYKVKPIIEYYDIALENLILIDKALLWYGNLTEEERDEMREQYAVDLVTLFGDINEIFASTQNGGTVIAGYTLDELIRLTDKASSLIDKIGENSFGGLEKDIKLMMGDVKYYLEKLGNDGKLPTGLTVAELTAINNKLASASEAYGKKDFALANDLYAEAIAQILNHVVDVVREAKASGTIDGENLEEKLSHIPFVNKFSARIIDMIVDMADNGFAKEYTKDIILETFDVERIESIIIGHDTDERFTIDNVVDFIVPYIEDKKVESPEHSADEIVIDQYEKVAEEESVTLRRYLY